MSSEPSFSTFSHGTYARRSLITLDDSSPSTPSAIGGGDYLQQPKLQAGITRHYTSLQEHADHIRADDKSPGEGGLVRRPDNRRESFSWGVRSAYDDQSTGTGHPLPPEQRRTGTPPPLEDLIRKHVKRDSTSSRHPTLARDDTVGSVISNVSMGTASTLSHSDTRKSSIADFLVRHVPDMRMFPLGSTSEHNSEPKRRDSRNGRPNGGPLVSSKIERKLSFVFPPDLNLKDAHETTAKPTPVVEEPPTKLPDEPPTISAPAQRGLKDRRKVKMELTIPLEMSSLPTRGRLPIAHLSNITPSRPRSPKTPWVRKEQPRWHQDIGPKAVTIREANAEDQSYVSAGNTGDSSILPGDNFPDSPQSPIFERPPAKVRDRCYISRPRLGRSRSRHSGMSRSGTSESTSARTPDSSWTPEDARVSQEQQQRTKEDLQQLGQNARVSRRRRGWAGRWTSTGSDSPAQTPDLISSRRFSVTNLFKRSGRLSDQVEKGKKPQSSYNRPWRRRNSNPLPVPPNNLAHMPLPPAFVPPGLHRVPTPPMFDDNGDIKGKLADFFFDIHGAPGRRRAVNSPGRVWDSDALLMSLQTDLDDEDEEEGPEGRIRDISPPVEFEQNYGTPGLMTDPDGYLTIRGANPGYRVSSPGIQDSWLQMQHGETPDEQALTVFALNESDERRKFEWLVPEHLPNSPLCPLHDKYRGPSIGVCYWHGRQSAGGKKSGEQMREGEIKRAGEQSAQRYAAKVTATKQKSKGLYDPPRGDTKKRRLASLSSP